MFRCRDCALEVSGFNVKRKRRASLVNLFCLIALILSGVAAALSAIAVPFWLMGVPGVENSYAKGWKIGLYAVIVYPILWCCVLGFWRSAKKQGGVEQLSDLNMWTGISSLALFIAAAAVLSYAFRVMSRQ